MYKAPIALNTQKKKMKWSDKLYKNLCLKKYAVTLTELLYFFEMYDSNNILLNSKKYWEDMEIQLKRM